MKKLLLFSLFIIPTYYLAAQSSIEQLNSYMTAAAKGSYAPAPQSILQDTQNATGLMEALVVYQNDSSSRIRSKAYNISKRIGQAHPELIIRQQAINQQIKALDDEDAGIMIKAINALTGFKNTDFNKNQQIRIINRLKADMSHLEDYALLVGFMPNEAAMAPLKEVLSQTTKGWVRFNLQLAMARRGDAAATQEIVNKMNTAPINDAFVYDVVPVLVYSRTKEVFKFLEGIIFSDSAACSSANPDSESEILCGYRVMEYMVPTLQNAPLTVDAFGELDVDDYEVALQSLRAWLLQNPDYELNIATY